MIIITVATNYGVCSLTNSVLKLRQLPIAKTKNPRCFKNKKSLSMKYVVTLRLILASFVEYLEIKSSIIFFYQDI